MSVTNLTEIYASKIDEKFAPMQVTNAGVNQDYSWEGAKAIKITSVTDGAMTDYDRDAGFGTPAALDNALQNMELLKDRKFNILLDRMDENESMIKSGEVLARQLRNVVNPEIEADRLKKMLLAVPVANEKTMDNTTVNNSYTAFLSANEALDDNDVPQENRVAFVTPAFYNLIKLDPLFIKSGDLSQTMLLRGQVGEIDGVPIIKTKKTWMTDGVKNFEALIVHKSATVAPIKLASYRMISNSEHYDGTLFQGRFVYDTFVLTNKLYGLASIEDVTP